MDTTSGPRPLADVDRPAPTPGGRGRLLLIDDDRVMRDVARCRLRTCGFAVTAAADGAEGLLCAALVAPDAILLDLELPDRHGLDVLDELAAAEATAAVPVVVVTQHDDPELVRDALRRGAQDFVAKPVHWDVLAARIDVAVRHRRLQADLRATNAELARQAQTDELTGLPNRRHGRDQLARRRGAAGTLQVVRLDLDGFKAVNDSLGHAAGDEVLRHLGGVLRGALRPADHLSRWGGDEFVVLLADAGAGAAALAAERLRAAVRADPLAGARSVTASVGWAAGAAGDAEDVLARADRAVYAAKAGGGDAVAGS